MKTGIIIFLKPVVIVGLTLLFLTFTNQLCVAALPDSSQIKYSEMPEYKIPQSKYLAVLDMGYANSSIKNAKVWKVDRRNRQVVIVDLVFTQYPRSKDDWKTNYDTLLNRRISALQELIPQLKEDEKVQWNFILQTNCNSETDAKEMFHGAIIKFKLILPKGLRESLSNVRNIVTGRIDFQDSVVFKVFERNPDWQDMLIVKDWTGSMYDYGAQAILWHRLNMEKNAVKHIVFFNDGNQKESKEKVIGSTGGIYTAKPQDIKNVIKVMREVMLEGNGGDSEENDIEALLFSSHQFNDFKELILIADNKSAIRDISLAKEVKKPVRIILCGTEEAPVVNPDYLTLAQKTGGSIHTIEEDLQFLGKRLEGEKIDILGVSYQLINGVFTPLINNTPK